MSADENDRTNYLRGIGTSVFRSIYATLDAAYDCNCCNCRLVVLFEALKQSLEAEGDGDEAEVCIRVWVKHLLTMRRQLREQAAFVEACEDAGLDPNAFTTDGPAN